MLVGVEVAEEFIETVIFTGFIKGHAPVSTLFIGSAETGKTSIVTSKQCKAIVSVTDATGRGLVELCKANPQFTHLVINDMVAIMSHRQTVNRYMQAMLNALTEEGITTMATPAGVEQIANGKRGVIACITLELVKDGRAWWNKTGFSSRVIPFAFSHSVPLSLRIKAYIDTGEGRGKHDKKKLRSNGLRLPSSPVAVAFPEKWVKEVRHIADAKSKELCDPTGYRRLRQYRALACAHALRRSRKKPAVNEHDIEWLHRISPHVTYDKLTPL
jgi:hypothetical protein